MINEVISKIVSLQTGPDSKHGEGLFLCRRENRIWEYSRPDNNIFGTASVVFLLKEISGLLSSVQQEMVDGVSRKAAGAYGKYRNKDGLETYNFWETSPSNHFPFGYIFKHFDHFRLPDDIDDTSLIYLNLEHTEEQNRWLKSKLKMHAGDSGRYSTWFGKNMPHEQDICALSNLMYWVLKNKLPLDEMDHDTLMWMRSVILSDAFVKYPFTVARHYASSPLIIYHLARLLFKFEVAELLPVKPHLIKHACRIFEKETSGLNKIILSTSLWKLGVRDSKYDIDYNTIFDERLNLKGQENFYSFIGALLGPYAHPFVKSIAGSELTRINWKCEAHELALCLENMILTKSVI